MTLFRFLPRRWWSVKAWQTWFSYVHWRLETYGVYYPNQKLNIHSLGLMARQLPAYLKWITALDQERKKAG